MNRIKLTSAFTSFLTVLAALPYELGQVAMIIPPTWKAPVALSAAIATIILRSFSANDKTS